MSALWSQSTSINIFIAIIIMHFYYYFRYYYYHEINAFLLIIPLLYFVNYYSIICYGGLVLVTAVALS